MELGYVVVLRKNGKPSPQYGLEKGEHTIGSSKDSNIRLKISNPLLLETHAVIRVNSNGVATLVNKSTGAPVKINEKTVFKPTILRHEDTFQILDKEFQYFNDDLKDEPEDSEIYANEKKNILARSRKSVMPLAKTPAKSPTFKTKCNVPKTPSQRLLNKSLGTPATKSLNKSLRTPSNKVVHTTASSRRSLMPLKHKISTPALKISNVRQSMLVKSFRLSEVKREQSIAEGNLLSLEGSPARPPVTPRRSHISSVEKDVEEDILQISNKSSRVSQNVTQHLVSLATHKELSDLETSHSSPNKSRTKSTLNSSKVFSVSSSNRSRVSKRFSTGDRVEDPAIAITAEDEYVAELIDLNESGKSFNSSRSRKSLVENVTLNGLKQDRNTSRRSRLSRSLDSSVSEDSTADEEDDLDVMKVEQSLNASKSRKSLANVSSIKMNASLKQNKNSSRRSRSSRSLESSVSEESAADEEDNLEVVQTEKSFNVSKNRKSVANVSANKMEASLKENKNTSRRSRSSRSLESSVSDDSTVGEEHKAMQTEQSLNSSKGRKSLANKSASNVSSIKMDTSGKQDNSTSRASRSLESSVSEDSTVDEEDDLEAMQTEQSFDTSKGGRSLTNKSATNRSSNKIDSSVKPDNSTSRRSRASRSLESSVSEDSTVGVEDNLETMQTEQSFDTSKGCRSLTNKSASNVSSHKINTSVKQENSTSTRSRASRSLESSVSEDSTVDEEDDLEAMQTDQSFNTSKGRRSLANKSASKSASNVSSNKMDNTVKHDSSTSTRSRASRSLESSVSEDSTVGEEDNLQAMQTEQSFNTSKGRKSLANKSASNVSSNKINTSVKQENSTSTRSRASRSLESSVSEDSTVDEEDDLEAMQTEQSFNTSKGRRSLANKSASKSASNVYSNKMDNTVKHDSSTSTRSRASRSLESSVSEDSTVGEEDNLQAMQTEQSFNTSKSRRSVANKSASKFASNVSSNKINNSVKHDNSTSTRSRASRSLESSVSEDSTVDEEDDLEEMQTEQSFNTSKGRKSLANKSASKIDTSVKQDNRSSRRSRVSRSLESSVSEDSMVGKENDLETMQTEQSFNTSKGRRSLKNKSASNVSSNKIDNSVKHDNSTSTRSRASRSLESSVSEDSTVDEEDDLEAMQTEQSFNTSKGRKSLANKSASKIDTSVKQDNSTSRRSRVSRSLESSVSEDSMVGKENDLETMQTEQSFNTSKGRKSLKNKSASNVSSNKIDTSVNQDKNTSRRSRLSRSLDFIVSEDSTAGEEEPAEVIQTEKSLNSSTTRKSLLNKSAKLSANNMDISLNQEKNTSRRSRSSRSQDSSVSEDSAVGEEEEDNLPQKNSSFNTSKNQKSLLNNSRRSRLSRSVRSTAGDDSTADEEEVHIPQSNTSLSRKSLPNKATNVTPNNKNISIKQEVNTRRSRPSRSVSSEKGEEENHLQISANDSKSKTPQASRRSVGNNASRSSRISNNNTSSSLSRSTNNPNVSGNLENGLNMSSSSSKNYSRRSTAIIQAALSDNVASDIEEANLRNTSTRSAKNTSVTENSDSELDVEGVSSFSSKSRRSSRSSNYQDEPDINAVNNSRTSRRLSHMTSEADISKNAISNLNESVGTTKVSTPILKNRNSLFNSGTPSSITKRVSFFAHSTTTGMKKSSRYPQKESASGNSSVSEDESRGIEKPLFKTPEKSVRLSRNSARRSQTAVPKEVQDTDIEAALNSSKNNSSSMSQLNLSNSQANTRSRNSSRVSPRLNASEPDTDELSRNSSRASRSVDTDDDDEEGLSPNISLRLSSSSSSRSAKLGSSLASSLSEDGIPATQAFDESSDNVFLNEEGHSVKEGRQSRKSFRKSTVSSRSRNSVFDSTVSTSPRKSIGLGDSTLSTANDDDLHNSVKEAANISSKRMSRSRNLDTTIGGSDAEGPNKSSNLSKRSLNSSRTSRKVSVVSVDSDSILSREHSYAVRASRSLKNSNNSLLTDDESLVAEDDLSKSLQNASRSIKNDMSACIEEVNNSLRNSSRRSVKGEQPSLDTGSSPASTDHNSRETTLNTHENSAKEFEVSSSTRMIRSSKRISTTFDESTQDNNINAFKNRSLQSKGSFSDSTKEALQDLSDNKSMKPISILDDTEEVPSPVKPLKSRKSASFSQDGVSVVSSQRSSIRRSLKGQITENSSLTMTSMDQSTGSVISVSSQSFSSFKKADAENQDETEIDVVNVTATTDNSPDARKSLRLSRVLAKTPSAADRLSKRASINAQMFDDVSCTSTPFHKAYVSKKSQQHLNDTDSKGRKSSSPSVLVISSTNVTLKSPNVTRSRSVSTSLALPKRRSSSRSSVSRNGDHNCVSCRHSSVKRSRSLSVSHDASEFDSSKINSPAKKMFRKWSSKPESPLLQRKSLILSVSEKTPEKSSTIDDDDDETPKSHIKPSRRSSKANQSTTYNPVLEDITPVTPEKLQVSGFTEEVFKTPINTPGLFESIRKSVIQSRKRHRDSNGGSPTKDSKRARVDFTQEEDKSPAPLEVPLLEKPKQKSPLNRLSNFEGVKKLMKTPAKSPKNDLRNIPNLRRMMSPKVQNSPKNDLTAPVGVKRLLRSPRTLKHPTNDLTNISGVANIFNVSGIEVLHQGSDIENSEDLFTKLTGKRPVKLYPRGKSLSPNKAELAGEGGSSRKTMGDLPVFSPRVQMWIDEHANYDVEDKVEQTLVEEDLFENISEKPGLRSRAGRSMSAKKAVLEKSSRRKSHGAALKGTPNVDQWKLEKSVEDVSKSQEDDEFENMSKQPGRRSKTGRSVSPQKPSSRNAGTPKVDEWKDQQTYENSPEIDVVEDTDDSALDNMPDQPTRRSKTGRSMSPQKSLKKADTRRKTHGHYLKDSPNVTEWKSQQNATEVQVANVNESLLKQVSEHPGRRSKTGRNVSPKKGVQTPINRRKTHGDFLKGTPDVDEWKSQHDAPKIEIANVNESLLKQVSEHAGRRSKTGRNVSPKKGVQTPINRRKTQGDFSKGTPDVDEWKSQQDSAEIQVANVNESLLNEVSEHPGRRSKTGRRISPKKGVQTPINRRKTHGDFLKGTPDVDEWKSEQNNLPEIHVTDADDNVFEYISEKPTRTSRTGRSVSPSKSTQKEASSRKTRGDFLKAATPDLHQWQSEKEANEVDNLFVNMTEKPGRKSKTGCSVSPRKSTSGNADQFNLLKTTPNVDAWKSAQTVQVITRKSSILSVSQAVDAFTPVRTSLAQKAITPQQNTSEANTVTPISARSRKTKVELLSPSPVDTSRNNSVSEKVATPVQLKTIEKRSPMFPDIRVEDADQIHEETHPTKRKRVPARAKRAAKIVATEEAQEVVAQSPLKVENKPLEAIRRGGRRKMVLSVEDLEVVTEPKSSPVVNPPSKRARSRDEAKTDVVSEQLEEALPEVAPKKTRTRRDKSEPDAEEVVESAKKPLKGRRGIKAKEASVAEASSVENTKVVATNSRTRRGKKESESDAAAADVEFKKPTRGRAKKANEDDAPEDTAEEHVVEDVAKGKQAEPAPKATTRKGRQQAIDTEEEIKKPVRGRGRRNSTEVVVVKPAADVAQEVVESKKTSRSRTRNNTEEVPEATPEIQPKTRGRRGQKAAEASEVTPATPIKRGRGSKKTAVEKVPDVSATPEIIVNTPVNVVTSEKVEESHSKARGGRRGQKATDTPKIDDTPVTNDDVKVQVKGRAKKAQKVTDSIEVTPSSPVKRGGRRGKKTQEEEPVEKKEEVTDHEGELVALKSRGRRNQKVAERKVVDEVVETKKPTRGRAQAATPVIEDVASPVKKGGRRTNKEPIQESAEHVNVEEATIEESKPAPRSRRNAKKDEDVQQETKQEPVVKKATRGRKAKDDVSDEPQAAAEVEPAKPPAKGRQRKTVKQEEPVVAEDSDDDVEFNKPTRGRPKKANATSEDAREKPAASTRKPRRGTAATTVAPTEESVATPSSPSATTTTRTAKAKKEDTAEVEEAPRRAPTRGRGKKQEPAEAVKPKNKTIEDIIEMDVDSPRTARANRGLNKKYSVDEYEVPKEGNNKRKVHFEEESTETPEVTTKRTRRARK